MRVYGVRPVFIRHPLKNFLLGVGLLAGLTVAMTGIAVLIVLLAVGGAAAWAVAWVYRSLRGPSEAAPRATAAHDAQVIDGEFEVVGDRRKPVDYAHRLNYDGPARG